MSSLTKRSLVVVSTMLAGAASAGAAEAQLSSSGCAQGSTSSFQVCASSTMWYEEASGTLFFDVVNLNQSHASNPSFADYASATGGWHTITAIGLRNMVLNQDYTVGAGGLSLSLNYWNGSNFQAITPTFWTVGANSIQIDNTAGETRGHEQGLVGGYDPGPGTAGHLQTTNGRYARFAIAGFTGLTFNTNAMFAWHSQQVATEGCSDITGDCATANSLKGAGTTVPEPISMALLGSGLLGVGVARRRRKENSESSLTPA